MLLRRFVDQDFAGIDLVEAKRVRGVNLRLELDIAMVEEV